MDVFDIELRELFCNSFCRQAFSHHGHHGGHRNPSTRNARCTTHDLVVN